MLGELSTMGVLAPFRLSRRHAKKSLASWQPPNDRKEIIPTPDQTLTTAHPPSRSTDPLRNAVNGDDSKSWFIASCVPSNQSDEPRIGAGCRDVLPIRVIRKFRKPRAFQPKLADLELRAHTDLDTVLEVNTKQLAHLMP